MSSYSIRMTDDPITGAQATVTVAAEKFLFNEDYVLFLDGTEHAVYAVPLSREPVIQLVTP